MPGAEVIAVADRNDLVTQRGVPEGTFQRIDPLGHEKTVR